MLSSKQISPRNQQTADFYTVWILSTVPSLINSTRNKCSSLDQYSTEHTTEERNQMLIFPPNAAQDWNYLSLIIIILNENRTNRVNALYI